MTNEKKKELAFKRWLDMHYSKRESKEKIQKQQQRYELFIHLCEIEEREHLTIITGLSWKV